MGVLHRAYLISSVPLHRGNIPAVWLYGLPSCEFSTEFGTTSTDIATLQVQSRELNDRLADVKRDEKRAALDAIRDNVALYGISEAELLSAACFRKPPKRRTAVKYYDPSSGREWSGFGPRLKWLEGKNLDDYLIDRAPKPWWPEKEA